MKFNFVRSVSVSARAGSEVRHHAGNRIDISRDELKGVCLNLSLGLRVEQPVPSIAAGVGGGIGAVRLAAGQRSAVRTGAMRRANGNEHRRSLLGGGGVKELVVFELRFPAPH